MQNPLNNSGSKDTGKVKGGNFGRTYVENIGIILDINKMM